jgi:release factor glutamine methyltransferase
VSIDKTEKGASISIQQLVRLAFNKARLLNLEDSDLSVIFVIEHVFGRPYLTLISNNSEVTCEQKQTVFELLQAYADGQPLAYVLGNVRFRKNTYYVSPGVLIPRPETEELVEISHSIIESLQSPVVLECGVGSGVISLELAMCFPKLLFLGWDISSTAIRVAQKNQAQLGVSNVHFMEGNFFSNVFQNYQPKKTHVLVSNPPYISNSEYNQLDAVVKCEPKLALVAENNGLAIIFELIEFSVALTMVLVCEIGYCQKSLIIKQYPHTPLVFLKDMSGHDRFLIYIPPTYSIFDNFLAAPQECGGVRN